MFVNLSNYYFS